MQSIISLLQNNGYSITKVDDSFIASNNTYTICGRVYTIHTDEYAVATVFPSGYSGKLIYEYSHKADRETPLADVINNEWFYGRCPDALKAYINGSTVSATAFMHWLKI